MTLRHLEIFMAVCRHMSMSEAAKELTMTQPAVSKAVSELEAFYNVSLFDRLNRRIYLTEAGMSLRQYADTILTQFEESAAYLRDGNSFSSCRLCVNVTAGETVLAQLLDHIHQKMPGLSLHVGIYNSGSIAQMIRSNECDLGIIDRGDDPSFESVRLYEEKTALFATEQYCQKTTLKPDELKSYRLLVRENGSGTREAINPLLKDTGYPLSSIWESTSDEALISLAENHLGIAVLPCSCVKNRPHLHEIQIENISLMRTFYLTFLKNKYISSAIRSCADAICSYCESL